MNWFSERFSEASSYAGLAAISVGVSQLFGIQEAATVADAIGTGGQVATQTGDWVQGILTSVLGAVALLRKG